VGFNSGEEDDIGDQPDPELKQSKVWSITISRYIANLGDIYTELVRRAVAGTIISFIGVVEPHESAVGDDGQPACPWHIHLMLQWKGVNFSTLKGVLQSIIGNVRHATSQQGPKGYFYYIDRNDRAGTWIKYMFKLNVYPTIRNMDTVNYQGVDYPRTFSRLDDTFKGSARVVNAFKGRLEEAVRGEGLGRSGNQALAEEYASAFYQRSGISEAVKMERVSGRKKQGGDKKAATYTEDTSACIPSATDMSTATPSQLIAMGDLLREYERMQVQTTSSSRSAIAKIMAFSAIREKKWDLTTIDRFGKQLGLSADLLAAITLNSKSLNDAMTFPLKPPMNLPKINPEWDLKYQGLVNWLNLCAVSCPAGCHNSIIEHMASNSTQGPARHLWGLMISGPGETGKTGLCNMIRKHRHVYSNTSSFAWLEKWYEEHQIIVIEDFSFTIKSTWEIVNSFLIGDPSQRYEVKHSSTVKTRTVPYIFTTNTEIHNTADLIQAIMIRSPSTPYGTAAAFASRFSIICLDFPQQGATPTDRIPVEITGINPNVTSDPTQLLNSYHTLMQAEEEARYAQDLQDIAMEEESPEEEETVYHQAVRTIATSIDSEEITAEQLQLITATQAQAVLEAKRRELKEAKRTQITEFRNSEVSRNLFHRRDLTPEFNSFQTPPSMKRVKRDTQDWVLASLEAQLDPCSQLQLEHEEEPEVTDSERHEHEYASQFDLDLVCPPEDSDIDDLFKG
jgi:hypothetical protein